ncbi:MULTISPECIES: geranylgeranyl reductase family protein [Streptomyces]|uniref:Drug:proton antiporter n=1 Tax=Streptomyces viridochromogenes TaxID=1938 RepID=A0A0L8J0W2_STRVR|nr:MULTISPECIES: geranylgeranyl reductase family protein [Streptomyces]KOG07437.1 drug:proton antiporter [Streptomyces viridochromogenes]
MDLSPHRDSADVIVVGAGPAGCAAAYRLALAGHDVLLIEKATFPRDKICGDGLTPRAVKELVGMGVDIGGDGWVRTRGLRAHASGTTVEMPWPSVASFPDFGLVRSRMDLDELLARKAVAAGARLLEGTKVTGPVIDPATGHVCGVTAVRDGETRTHRAPLVVAADGASSRLAVALGLHQRADRPMGVAVRRYYTVPSRDQDHLEAWLDLETRDARGRTYMPFGYGWVFPVGGGTFNVGLGTFHVGRKPDVDHRQLFREWTARLSPARLFDDDHATGPLRGAPLPAGFNRRPQYTRGLLLTGDAGGMINPLSGEGIDYAMESGRLAADTVSRALGRPTAAAREEALQGYPEAVRAAYGRYFTVGRLVVHALNQPRIMKLVATRSLSRPVLQRFMFKLWANLTDPHSKDALDRVITAIQRAVPAA